MKTSIKFASLVVSVMMGALGATAYAMEVPRDGSAERQTYRDVPGMEVHHYPFVVGSEARWEVRSESPQFLGSHVWLLSRLLDGDGNVVATGRNHGGGFVIEKTLSEGDYMLEVRSRFLGASHENSRRYAIRMMTF
ncbi:hypothetical protein [Halomonas sp. C05BenzN]|uniref:hypothetical protein n=1 Tax=Halomonas sp. C05BenzN TaxID=3411041 RepID=UPI003B949E16